MGTGFFFSPTCRIFARQSIFLIDFGGFLMMYLKSKVLVTQSCPALWNPMDCSLPGSSDNRILQARILEWVAIPFFRGSSQPRDWTQGSCMAGRFFATGPPGKSLAFPDLALCCTGWSPSSYCSSFGDGAPVCSSESISPHVLVSMSTCTSQNPKVGAVYSGYRITCLD